MIDIRLVRESPEVVRAALERRDASLGNAVTQLTQLDERRRSLVLRVEKLKAERNLASQKVAELKRVKSDASSLISELQELSGTIKDLDRDLKDVESELQEKLLCVPNIPLDDLPLGDVTANKIVREWGEVKELQFTPRPHWELGENLGMLDLPRGAAIAGSGFPVFIGMGARLVRALVNFMMDLHVEEHGYVEVAPPLLVTEDSARGTGQIPDLEDNMYRTTDGLFLIPTAEVPVTNLHQNEIFAPGSLPRSYVAYTPCFRREAGAHGKDTRGIIRVHQFDKVELVSFVEPQDSPNEQEKLLQHAEAVLQRLDLPYRVVLLATGDIGFASAKTYDLEVWAAGVGQWLEVSSASTFTDFQARRANIRYRASANAKPSFVHTLNASGVALPRTIIALLENNQHEDGSVSIPDSLVPYLGADRLTPSGKASG